MGKEINFNFSKLFQNSPKTQALSQLLPWAVHHVFFLPLHQMEEKERRQEVNDGQNLGLQESSWSIALVAMKNLLWYISCCDKVSPSRITSRILASTRSGDLISNSLNLEQASSF